MNKNISNEIQILINQFNVGNSENVILKGKILIKKNPGFLILYNLVGSAYQKQVTISMQKNILKKVYNWSLITSY